jgi:hypothetical protein
MAKKAASLGNAWENARSIAEVYGLTPEEGDDYGDSVAFGPVLLTSLQIL